VAGTLQKVTDLAMVERGWAISSTFIKLRSIKYGSKIQREILPMLQAM